MKLLEKPLLTEAELSHVLNVSVHTLQKQRRQGRGIKFCRVGRCVRYASQKDNLKFRVAYGDGIGRYCTSSEYFGHRA